MIAILYPQTFPILDTGIIVFYFLTYTSKPMIEKLFPFLQLIPFPFKGSKKEGSPIYALSANTCSQTGSILRIPELRAILGSCILPGEGPNIHTAAPVWRDTPTSYLSECFFDFPLYIRRWIIQSLGRWIGHSVVSKAIWIEPIFPSVNLLSKEIYIDG